MNDSVNVIGIQNISVQNFKKKEKRVLLENSNGDLMEYPKDIESESLQYYESLFEGADQPKAF